MMKFIFPEIADWFMEKLILAYIMLVDFFERFGLINSWDQDYE